MKLASLKDGRDGRLVVVSADLAWCAEADHIAPSLKAALASWAVVEPDLRGLSESLEHGFAPRRRFHERDAASALPRGVDGQAAFREPRADIPLPQGGACELRADLVAATADGDVRLVMLQLSDGGCAALSPVAVTPDELDGWRDGRISGRLELELNGRPAVETDATVEVADFDVPAHGEALVGCGTGVAASLHRGDVGRLEMRDLRRHSVFGAIEHRAAG